MAHSDITIKLDVYSEELQRTYELLHKENQKAMATISANTASDEEQTLSGLDYDELLETYGDDPVLMTIFNRMKDFFSRPEEDKWFRFKDWPKGGSASVSDTFTVKFDDTTGKGMVVKSDSVSYSINIE